MRRREFIAGLGGAAAMPLVVHAQQSAIPVIGVLNTASPSGYVPIASAFRQGLKETGYVDGQNVAIEYRWAEGQNDLLPAMAADLVRRQVAVIVATSAPAALAAKAATATIPIVFETGADPVALGLVASLSQPGGNITGVTQTNVEMAPKRLQLLYEVIPAAKVMGLLVNPTDGVLAESYTKEVQAAARSLGLELHVLNASSERDLDVRKTEPYTGGGASDQRRCIPHKPQRTTCCVCDPPRDANNLSES